MTTAPRDALDRFVAALEAHLDAVTRRTGEADPAVTAAYQTLADAFETYDDALYDTFDEVTPFILVDETEEDDDEEDLDDDLDDLDEDDLDEDDLVDDADDVLDDDLEDEDEDEDEGDEDDDEGDESEGDADEGDLDVGGAGPGGRAAPAPDGGPGTGQPSARL